jgi:hypothetical protein
MHHQYFHIGFEVISYDYNQLCSHLGHLVINFLVAKDKIPSCDFKKIVGMVKTHEKLYMCAKKLLEQAQNRYEKHANRL